MDWSSTLIPNQYQLRRQEPLVDHMYNKQETLKQHGGHNQNAFMSADPFARSFRIECFAMMSCVCVCMTYMSMCDWNTTRCLRGGCVGRSGRSGGLVCFGGRAPCPCQFGQHFEQQGSEQQKGGLREARESNERERESNEREREREMERKKKNGTIGRDKRGGSRGDREKLTREESSAKWRSVTLTQVLCQICQMRRSVKAAK